MKLAKFTLADIEFADSPAMFKRAHDLYQQGKVGNITETRLGYSAIVAGSTPYSVRISAKEVDQGDCSCYMGQRGLMCKHLLALALSVLDINSPTNVTPRPTDLPEIKKIVTKGMRNLCIYTGSSSDWFHYQRKLATGSGIILQAISELSATKENAQYLWKLIQRIDKKLVNGIDDSDGIIGECAQTIIEQLASYTNGNPALKATIKCYCSKETNFNFENDLLKAINSTTSQM